MPDQNNKVPDYMNFILSNRSNFDSTPNDVKNISSANSVRFL